MIWWFYMVLCQFAHVSSFIHRFHFPLHHLVTAPLHTTALQIVSYIFCWWGVLDTTASLSAREAAEVAAEVGLNHQHAINICGGKHGKLKGTTANICKMHMWAHNMYVHTHIHARIHTGCINSEGPSQDVNHVSLWTAGMTHVAGRGRSHQKASQGCGQMQPTLFGLLVY